MSTNPSEGTPTVGTVPPAHGGARTEQSARPGDVIGGYVLEERAGAGGMGVVYRARDRELERPVALKLIAFEYARDPAFRQLFIRESLVAASVEHPNVVPVYRAGEDGDRLFIAMRFIDGESLGELITRRGRLPVAQAVRIVGQVAGALEAAHGRGLLHRDVKPGNVMVTGVEGEEHAFLTDFGLAVRFTEGGHRGRWSGTLAYLAPEQIRGGALDARTDVYGLGCVLFHALTGRTPYGGREERSTLVAHLTEPPPRPSDLVAGVPRGLDEVVRRAMAKRPEDRFQSARELADALAAQRFDAVLVHGDDDAAAAAAVRALLTGEGLEVWDRATGDGSLSEALRVAGAAVVVVGAGGLGEWAREPLAQAQDLAARDRGFRLGAALTPGAPDPFGPAMAPMTGRRWADLRAGLDDPDGRRELLRLVREDAPASPDPGTPDVNPYRGLAAFGEQDARFYVGREDDVARIVERLRERRMLMLTGPSGAGKSSVLQAGVLPALRREGAATWRVATLTPGARPLAALAAAVAELVPPSSTRPGAGELGTDVAALRRAIDGAVAGPPADERALLLVDQFEEAFTLADANERRAFVDALVHAGTIPGSRIWVVLAMRADFTTRLAEHPALRDIAGSAQELLGPMGPRQLRRVIETPARRAGLTLEPGLTRRILADVADRPGSLPLLQHLLLELWNRRRGRELTLEAYAASGGVEGALARRAEEVHAGLTPAGQATARRVMLRLTQPGEGTEDTRRRAEMDELARDDRDVPEVDAVVGALAAARLVTTGADPATGRPTVEVAHEALIRGWPRLRGWIDEERGHLVAQHRLTEAAAEWERTGEDAGLLYRGARLAAWRERETADLSGRERAFLLASIDAEDGERRAARRRTRVAIAALSTGLVVLGAAGGYALVQRNDATDSRAVAQSRQLAVNAREQAVRDPDLGVLLAREAVSAARTPDALWALRQAVFSDNVAGTITHGGGTLRLATDGDGTRLLTGALSDGTARLWDVATGTEIAEFAAGRPDVFGVALSRDGTRMVMSAGGAPGGPGARLEVRQLPGTQLLSRIDMPGQGTFSTALSPDGRLVAAADFPAGTVRLWRAADGRPVRTVGTLPGGGAALTFSPDGRRLALGGFRGSARVWDLDTGRETTLPAANGVNDLAFSPDGRTLAGTGLGTPDVYVWPLDGGAPRRWDVPADQALGVDVSPDGRHLAVTGGDGIVRVYDITGGEPLAELRGHAGLVYRARFLPDGRRLVTGGEDDRVRIWRWHQGVADRADVAVTATVPVGGDVLRVDDAGRVTGLTDGGRVLRWRPGGGRAPAVAAPVGPVNGGAVDRDGRPVAWTDLSSGTSNALRVRPATAPRRPLRIPDVNWNVAAVSANGRWLTAGAADGVVRLWDLRAGGAPRSLGTLSAGGVSSLAVSDDGATVVAGGFDGTLAAFGADGTRVAMDGVDGTVLALAVAPDGGLAVSASQDRTVRVWDPATGGSLAVLRGHSGGLGSSVGLTADRRLVVSQAEDGVRVWDWRAGAEVLALPAERASQAAISPGGRWVAALSGPVDGRVTVTRWECDVCGPLAAVERRAGTGLSRTLTDDERAQFGVN